MSETPEITPEMQTPNFSVGPVMYMHETELVQPATEDQPAVFKVRATVDGVVHEMTYEDKLPDHQDVAKHFHASHAALKGLTF